MRNRRAGENCRRCRGWNRPPTHNDHPVGRRCGLIGDSWRPLGRPRTETMRPESNVPDRPGEVREAKAPEAQDVLKVARVINSAVRGLLAPLLTDPSPTSCPPNHCVQRRASILRCARPLLQLIVRRRLPYFPGRGIPKSLQIRLATGSTISVCLGTALVLRLVGFQKIEWRPPSWRSWQP